MGPFTTIIVKPNLKNEVLHCPRIESRTGQPAGRPVLDHRGLNHQKKDPCSLSPNHQMKDPVSLLPQSL
ncbi:20944_t:CDS:1, partial [Cetraspora pellucida]